MELAQVSLQRAQGLQQQIILMTKGESLAVIVPDHSHDLIQRKAKDLVIFKILGQLFVGQGAAFVIQRLGLQRGNEAALAGHGVNETGVLQFLPGPFDRDHADAQFFGNRADRRQTQIRLQLALDDLRADLIEYLLIDRVIGGIGDHDIHSRFTGLPFQS